MFTGAGFWRAQSLEVLSAEPGAGLAQGRRDTLHSSCKLWRVVTGWVLDLRKQPVNRRASVGISRAGFGNRNIQRIHRHRRLLGAALSLAGDSVAVSGDAFEQAQRAGAVVLRGVDFRNELFGQRSGVVCGYFHLGAFGTQRCDEVRDFGAFGFELLCGLRVDFAGEVPEDDKAGEVIGRIAGAMVAVTLLLPPALRSRKSVVAGNAVHLAKLRPRPRLRAACDTQHAFAHLHGLSNTPGPHPKQRVSILFHPMGRLDGGEGVQLESKVRMAGGDHLVVDFHALRTEMASE